MSRQNIKTPIVNWLAEGENAKFPVEKAYKQFQKEKKLQVREKAFYDYYKAYNAGTVAPKPVSTDPDKRPEVNISEDEITINVFNTDNKKNKKFPKDIFVPWATGKPIDILLSEMNGLMKGTTLVADGEAGVGKSTCVYDIQNQLRKNYPDANMICINSEMEMLDLQFERLGKEWMKNVNFCLLSDGNNVPNIEEGRSPFEYAKILLRKIFRSGYHIIFVDSFQDIVEKLHDYCGMTKKEAGNFLLGLCKEANEDKAGRGIYTSVVFIQQVNKDGDFVGSNSLKHNTTGFLHFRFDDRGERYAQFSKNRRGGKHVGKKMYFSLNEKNEVVWDKAEFEATEERSQMLKQEKQKVKESAARFMGVFSRPEGDETIGGKIKVDKSGDMESDYDEDEEDIED